MDEEARAHRRKELEERRKRLEALKAQNMTRSRENAERLRQEKSAKEEADRKLLQTIMKEVPLLTENKSPNVKNDPPIAPPVAPLVLEIQVGLAEVNITPTRKETYSQSTNTDADDNGTLKSLENINSPKSLFEQTNSGITTPVKSGISPRSSMSSLRARLLSPSNSATKDNHSSMIKNKQKNNDNDEDNEESNEIESFTEVEIQELLKNDDLVSFVSNKSTVIERVLGEALIFDATNEFIIPNKKNCDQLKNNNLDNNDRENIESNTTVRREKTFSTKKTNSLIKVLSTCDGSSVHQGGKAPISDLRWSPHRPEVFASSFGASGSENLETGGTVLLWSMALPGRPERKLTTHSPVLSLLFDPDDPSLLFGGTYSGQVVVWDVRSSSTLPVRRTALGGQCHTHPVFALSSRRRPLDNAWNLLSASSDGLLCEFEPNQLLQPSERMPLVFSGSVSSSSSSSSMLPVAVSCLSLVSGLEEEEVLSDVALLGSQSGDMFMTKIDLSHSASLKKEDRGILTGSERLMNGHQGLITALSAHPLRDRRLVLSAGVDWSTKLWSMNLPKTDTATSSKPLSPTKKQLPNNQQEKDMQMLCDFRGAYEPVSDVEWSPSHPSLFATANGSGQVSLWDVAFSLEDPRTSPLSVSTHSLTKLRWSHDGRRIVVGDLEGMVHLIGISPDIADAKSEAEADLDKALSKLW